MFKNYNVNNLLPYLLWIGLMVSINTLYRDATNIFKIKDLFDSQNIIIIINFFRYLFPFFIFFFLFKTEKKINIIFLLIIFYTLFQLIALIIFREFSDIIQNLYFIFAIIAICISLNIKNFDFNKNLKYFFYITVSLLILIIVLFLSDFLIQFFHQKEQRYLYYVNEYLIVGTKYFMQSIPRTTGLSRTLLIIFYFAISFFLLGKKFKIISAFIAIICLSLVYGFQSRGSFLGVFLFIFFILFFHNNNLFNKLKLLLIFIILPILIWEILFITKVYFHNKSFLFKESDKSFLVKEFDEIKKNPIYQNRLVNNIHASGRLEIWTNAIKIIKEKKIILGYGPQADRHLIKGSQKVKYADGTYGTLDNNSSNIFIYSYLSAGIFGLGIFVIIYIYLCLIIFKQLFFIKNYRNDFLLTFSILTASYLLIRGLIENSFSVFSLDMCLFLLVTKYLIQKHNI